MSEILSWDISILQLPSWTRYRYLICLFPNLGKIGRKCEGLTFRPLFQSGTHLGTDPNRDTISSDKQVRRYCETIFFCIEESRHDGWVVGLGDAIAHCPILLPFLRVFGGQWGGGSKILVLKSVVDNHPKPSTEKNSVGQFTFTKVWIFENMTAWSFARMTAVVLVSSCGFQVCSLLFFTFI